MRTTAPALALTLLAGCAGVRSYTRSTPTPLPTTYVCATRQLEGLGYKIEIEDSVGGLAQARREITGIVETARRGAAVATKVITAGLAGGGRTRYDELTVSIYNRGYPQGNTLEVTAGMLIVSGDDEERTSPTDDAKRDAKKLLAKCTGRR
jgi:hypothetical protein